MPEATPRRRRIAVAGFILVPPLLAAVWLARAEPPRPSCPGVAKPPGLDAAQADWLAGARLLLGAGGLIVVAATMLASGWSQAARGHSCRPGAGSIAIGALLAAYVVACAIDQDAFVVFGFLAILTAFTFGAPAAIFLAVAVIQPATRPRGRRREAAALAALGWCSFVIGVGGGAAYVGALVTTPLCLR